MKNILLIFSLIFMLGLVACKKPIYESPTTQPALETQSREGTFEKAGRKMDEGLRKAGEKIDESFKEAGEKTKEGFEKTGEKIKKATE
jgi:hypothetical protein